MSIILKTENVNVFFRKTQALKDISLEIEENTVTTFMGASGCGKSTLLYVFNRMHEVNRHETKVKVKGDVYFNYKGGCIDVYAQGTSPLFIRSSIGMVAQKPNLNPKTSIFDNVSLGLKINFPKSTQAFLKERVEISLQQAHIWNEVKDILETSPAKLSGGQQQRLCIARTLAVEPVILLMDEPTSALDPIMTQNIEELIFELKKNYTIILVTHSISQSKRMSDYVFFFNFGEIIEHGEAKELFTKGPKHHLFQEFIRMRYKIANPKTNENE